MGRFFVSTTGIKRKRRSGRDWKYGNLALLAVSVLGEAVTSGDQDLFFFFAAWRDGSWSFGERVFAEDLPTLGVPLCACEEASLFGP